jgi:hypothetical protein
MSDHTWTGACLCGSVSYAADGAPLASLICHCRDCQRASGTAGVPVVVLPKDRFRVKGEIRAFTCVGGSGVETTRNFCAVCGSLLFGLPGHAPDIVTIYAGTLDDPSRFQPTFAQFTQSRFALDGHGLALTEFPGRAP